MILLKKLALTIAPFILVQSAAVCQQSHLSVSEDFKIAEKDYQGQTVTHSVFHNDFFYTATNSGIGANYKWAFTKLYDLKYSVTVAKYDKNMGKVKEYLLENGQQKYGPLVPQLLLLNNRLALAYFQPDENKTSFSFFIGLVDEQNLTLSNVQKLCTLQQPNVGVFKLESVVNGNLVSFAFSQDKNKTLIVCVAGAGLLKTYVVDNTLRILKQSDLKTVTTGFKVSSAVLTQDNAECILMDSEEGIKVITNTPDKHKAETNLIVGGPLKPSNASLMASNDGKSIYICATGSDVLGEEKGCNGLLLYNLDCATMHLSKPFIYGFTPEQIQSFCESGAGSKHRKNYSMFNFTPAMTELPNGTLVVLGCPQQVSSSTRTSAPNMDNNTHQTATTTLEVGPVMAFFPDKIGKNLDYALIPRRLELSSYAQSGSGTIQIVQAPGITHEYSGFVSVVLGDKIMVFYNDDPDNVSRGLDAKVLKADSPKDLALAEAMFGADKKLQYRKQIGNDLKGRSTYYLGNLAPTSSGLIVFPIAKQGVGFNARKTFYTNWCFLNFN